MEFVEPSTQIKHPTDKSLINSYNFIHIFLQQQFLICPVRIFTFHQSYNPNPIMRICFYIIVNTLKSLSHEPSLAALVPMSLL